MNLHQFRFVQEAARRNLSVSTRPRQEVDSRGVSVAGQRQLSGSAVNWQSRP